MQNGRLDEAQARIKIAGRNINNLRYAEDTTIMAESKEELKSLLKVKEESEKKKKEESEKAGLKLSIQKKKSMAFRPITSWKTDGETMEQSQTFFSWAPKSLQMVTTVMKLKEFAPLKKGYD